MPGEDTERRGVIEYRRRPKSYRWHFHPGCRWWPELVDFDAVVRVPTKPFYGGLCNQCQDKTRKDKG